jgi:hypothetical protein
MHDDLENIKGAKERVDHRRGCFSTRRYRGGSLLCNWRVIRDPDWAIQIGSQRRISLPLFKTHPSF